MELIRGLTGLRPPHRPCVATIGAFDGVHRGHKAVIAQLKGRAAEHDLPATIVTFEPQPREYLEPDLAPARLSTLRDKCELLAACGVDRVVCMRFDEALRCMSAESFARKVLIEGLGIRSLILGDDFRFGRERQGDIELMKTLGESSGFTTLPTDTLQHEGERISSTRLRAVLKSADFSLAEALLGRPYSISGRVLHGRALGRQLGTPTANIALRRLVSPLSGVYAVTVTGAGLVAAHGVANVGARPSVSDDARHNLEVHILDSELQLYGQRLVVTPTHKLRGEQRFESLDALRAQIEADKNHARHFFAAEDGDTKSA